MDKKIPPDAELLFRYLRDIRQVTECRLETWDRLIRCARLAGILPRLATQIVNLGLLEDLPEPVQWHILAESRAADHFRQRILWELGRLQSALSDANTPLVLLKGAAYLAAELPPAEGRISSDIDLLVDKEKLTHVEQKLLAKGWESLRDDESLHTAYYLKWLHELPPLIHRHRKVVLDLHHNILPLRDPIQVSANRLIESSIPVPGHEPFRMLAPTDQVLHSAAHLFRIGDFEKGLRDLFDMHLLIEYHSKQVDRFTTKLVERAANLQLGRPCYLALRYLKHYFDTTISSETWEFAQRFRPLAPVQAWYDKHVSRALFPVRLDGEDHARNRSLWLLDKFPLPRVRSMLTPLFWIKRLSTAGARA